MVCKNCGTENPEGAVFCMQCGKRLDGIKNCPSCNALCPEEAIFCNACGARIVKKEFDEEAQKAQPQTESREEPASKERTKVHEKVKFAFDLSGGICLMVAVLFAFVFVFCMGITATSTTVSIRDGSVATTKSTVMLWDYFGSVYDDLAKALDLMTEYTTYYEAANYIPVVLTTVICAGTLLSVLICTIVAAVKYGKHFKNPNIQYAKPAVAAILSFVLGATAFLAVNFMSANSSPDVAFLSFSDAALAGIVLCGVFLGLYFIFKTAAFGKDFIKKQSIAEFVCTTVGIVSLILVAAFAAAPAMSFSSEVINIAYPPAYAISASQPSSFDLNFALSFANLNRLLSTMSADEIKLHDDFDATYVCSALAQAAQIAFLVLAFVTLIEWLGGYGNHKKSCLGNAVALFSVAVVYLVLSCVTLHFCTKLIAEPDDVDLSIAAAPIVAIVFSAFALAASITHKCLMNKFKISN